MPIETVYSSITLWAAFIPDLPSDSPSSSESKGGELLSVLGMSCSKKFPPNSTPPQELNGSELLSFLTYVSQNISIPTLDHLYLYSNCFIHIMITNHPIPRVDTVLPYNPNNFHITLPLSVINLYGHILYNT